MTLKHCRSCASRTRTITPSPPTSRLHVAAWLCKTIRPSRCTVLEQVHSRNRLRSLIATSLTGERHFVRQSLLGFTDNTDLALVSGYGDVDLCGIRLGIHASPLFRACVLQIASACANNRPLLQMLWARLL